MREKQKNHGIRRDAGKASTTRARKVRLVRAVEEDAEIQMKNTFFSKRTHL